MRNEWQTTKLSALYQIGSSRRVLKSEWKTSGVPFYRGREITRLAVNGAVENELFISEKHFAELSKQTGVPKSGDIVITAIGTIGNSYVVRHTDRFYFKDASVLWMKRVAKVSSEFINLWLKSPHFFAQLDKGNGATVDTLTIQKLQNVVIDLPPLAEQQRIVALLNDLFSSVEIAKVNAERNAKNAESIFESRLQSVFTERGRGWVEKRLGEIAEFKNGLNFTRQSKGQAIRMVGVGDFQDRLVVPIDALQSVTIDGRVGNDYLVCRDDILTVRSNGSQDLVGRCMLVPNVDEMTSFSGFIIRIRFNSHEINSRFVLHFMRSSGTRERLTRSGGGANISNISQVKLSKLPIYLPSVKQQEDAANSLDELREQTQCLANLYRRKLAALKNLKAALLHQAFSGELTKSVGKAAVLVFPTEVPGITITDLHAGILAMAYDRHHRADRTRTFGHVKAEKIAHMVEAHIGISLGRQPIKDAAGPNDYQRLLGVEHRARKAGYFVFKRVKGAGYRVKKLGQFDKLVRRARDALDAHAGSIDELLSLMLPMNSQQAEIFATVYAAWNNLLLDGLSPSDEEIVCEARENWHPDKLRIPRDKFFKAITWLREKGVVPTGRGRKVVAKTAA